MKTELLAPAKNAEQGILALRCGADAVYVGGPRFGARKGAANELADLELLIKEAHLWHARVYVTLNTILFEDELESARKAAWTAFEAGADALIIQDMAFLKMDLPDIPLHASTQAVCDSPEKVAFLAGHGFSRAILARELSLEQIESISNKADIELESFIYGALCVSESGRCYLSQAICGRSGNRGECAQPCRRNWNLIDENGKILVKDRPLLSIKDLDLSDRIESLMNVGVYRYKIEGRLKDADYIKNIVSYLRCRLDALLEALPDTKLRSKGFERETPKFLKTRAKPVFPKTCECRCRVPLIPRCDLSIATRYEFSRTSSGTVKLGFVPNPSKTFNRGHTKYCLDGKCHSISSGVSGGHLGELVGIVNSINGDKACLDNDHGLNPGDGLATPGPFARIEQFPPARDGRNVAKVSQNLSGMAGHDYRHGTMLSGTTIHGTLVNAVNGREVQVQNPAGIIAGSALFRNFDHRWHKELRTAPVERKITISAELDFSNGRAILKLVDEDGCRAEIITDEIYPQPTKPVAFVNTARNALSRLGNSPFILGECHVNPVGFLPLSHLNDLRRRAVEQLIINRIQSHSRQGRRVAGAIPPKLPISRLGYEWNVSNSLAKAFYSRLGATHIEPAFELAPFSGNPTLMTTKLCLKYELGWCPIHNNDEVINSTPVPTSDIYLQNGSITLKCHFDCQECKMRLLLQYSNTTFGSS